MKIKILESGKQDLQERFDFYESQETGIGNYFLETLFSDIESLRLFAGIHSVTFWPVPSSSFQAVSFRRLLPYRE